MERRWFAKWVQMCVAVNHYKVTDTFKCSRGERKDWLNRFNIPLSSLDSFLSCLGLITTHTHLTLLFHLHHNYCGEDRDQSKAHMRPSTAKQPHVYAYVHIYMDTHTNSHMHTHSHITTASPSIFSAWTSRYIPKSPLPPQEPAVFGIDFIYLMMAVLMTPHTWLMVSQTPQQPRNEDWMGAWRVKGGWYWRGQNEIGGAQQKDDGIWWYHVRRRSLPF